MKKLLVVSTFLTVLVLLSFLPVTANAFNSAAHIYIAEAVVGEHSIDFYYGSIAPDLSMYASDPKTSEALFEYTHYDYIDLRQWAWSSKQKAFARGWFTHNEGTSCGADHWAHIENPIPPANTKTYVEPDKPDGYVIEKACELQKQLRSQGVTIPDEFAHYAIETAIDLLIRNNLDHSIGQKLFNASLLRSWEDRNLVISAIGWKYRATIASAELTFRNLVNKYAIALSLPDPLNR
jgi:hypothetical protein